MSNTKNKFDKFFIVGILLSHFERFVRFLIDKAINSFFMKVSVDNPNVISSIMKWVATSSIRHKNFKLNSILYSPEFDIDMSPSEDVAYHLKFNNTYVEVKFEKDEKDDDGPSIKKQPKATVMPVCNLTFYTRDKKVVEEFFKFLNKYHIDLGTIIKTHTNIYANEYGSKYLICSIRKRPLSSVILDTKLKTDVIQFLDWFYSNQDFYESRGINYCCGVLLEGPPGNGKSSLVAAIASYFNKDVVSLSLKGSNLSDYYLRCMLTKSNPNEIILIEDIDCAFEDRKKRKKKNDDEDEDESVTPSGLLNSLDGVGYSSGRVVFMTTNYKERLDEALIRPGRVDLQIKITNADKFRAYEMFLRFFPGEVEWAKKFSDTFVEGSCSMAKLQQHFMLCKTPELAVLTEISLDKEEPVKDLEIEVNNSKLNKKVNLK